MATETQTRKSADVRRDEIVEAARVEFAIGGLHGTSTEDIARRAGVSQPYVFRLFGTKKELFLETVRRGFRHVLEVFQEAAAANREGDVFLSMGHAYGDVRRDRASLMFQMQAYAACEDDDICEVVRNGYGDLVAYAERVSGLPPEDVGRFFATGMLLNVIASMGLENLEEPWAARLVAGVKTK